MRVAIVAMGPTNCDWFNEVYYPKRRKDFHQEAFNALSEAVQKNNLPMTPQTHHGVMQLTQIIGDATHIKPDYDEIWVINNMGKLLRNYDKIFHMDDLTSPDAEGLPKDVTIVTSKARPGFKCEEYPINEVVRKFNSLYFNNTIAYAIAYALLKEAKFIGFYGCDFTPHNGDDAARVDAGASCCEYWLRVAEEMKVEYYITKGCRLMGMNTEQKLYGYMKQPVLELEDRTLKFENKKWNVTVKPQTTGSEKPSKQPKAAKVHKKPVRSRKKAE